MKVLTGLICCLIVASNATILLADDAIKQDSALIESAFSALNDGEFSLVIAKADQVIERFEKSKQPDTDYVCASAGPDVLLAMSSVALGMKADPQPSQAPRKNTTAAISSDICTAYFLKGFAFVDLQERKKALPNLEMAVALDPDNQHYINELAEWYKNGRQWQRSLELFTKASETTDFAVSSMDDKQETRRTLDDLRCRSYRGIAFNYAEMARWDEARAAIDKCLAIVPGDPKSNVEIEYIKAHSGG